jgi:hypothetical protein
VQVFFAWSKKNLWKQTTKINRVAHEVPGTARCRAEVPIANEGVSLHLSGVKIDVPLGSDFRGNAAFESRNGAFAPETWDMPEDVPPR